MIIELDKEEVEKFEKVYQGLKDILIFNRIHNKIVLSDENKVLIDKQELLNLLRQSAELDFLNCAGVNNWMGGEFGRKEFIASELGITEEEVEEKDLWFEDVANKRLEKYIK